MGEVSALEKANRDLEARVERGSTVALRVDLDALAGRLEALATSNRKEFGRLHAAQRKEPAAEPVGDDLAETIAFQRAWSGGDQTNGSGQ
jgi:hypothetical protein